MRGARIPRRTFLERGLLAGTGMVAIPALGCGRATADGESPVTRLDDPPEAKVLNSRAYGRTRIRRVQDALKKNGVDVLVVSNRGMDYISYVSNYHPSPFQPGVALIPAEGQPVLYLQMYSPAHARAARQTIWIDEVVDVPKDPVSESSSYNLYVDLLKTIRDRKLQSGRIGLAGGEVDWMLVSFFQAQLPAASVVEASDVLFSLVLVKDAVELGLMRYAQRIIDEVAYPQYQKSLKVGRLDSEVYADVLDAMLRAGSDAANSRLILGGGPYDSGAWAGGVEKRPLEADDIVLTRPIPRVQHYQMEKMFTFALSRSIPESQKRGAQVVHEAFLLTLEELKPGLEMRPIYEKVTNYIRSKGYAEGSWVPIGHWIGVDSHQGWRITSQGTRDLILQPNMILSWHPNVVVPGEARTCSSACLLITDAGVENMSKIPMHPTYVIEPGT